MKSKSIAKHTPTPWHSKAHVKHSLRGNSIVGADRIQVAYVHPRNAAFILRACNSHEEMLETLKNILIDFENLKDEAQSADVRSLAHTDAKLIRAIISKIEGRGE